MRRILLISDTHGNLDIINEKVSQTNADIVIHEKTLGTKGTSGADSSLLT